GPARGPQHVFVNHRIVRDRTIAHAISAAYSVATIKERSPEVHLFISLGPDRVDVNVHPTKAEVRFLDQSLVHEVLRRAIVDALESTSAPELVLSHVMAAASQPNATMLPGSVVLPFGLGPTSGSAPRFSPEGWPQGDRVVTGAFARAMSDAQQAMSDSTA